MSQSLIYFLNALRQVTSTNSVVSAGLEGQKRVARWNDAAQSFAQYEDAKGGDENGDRDQLDNCYIACDRVHGQLALPALNPHGRRCLVAHCEPVAGDMEDRRERGVFL